MPECAPVSDDMRRMTRKGVIFRSALDAEILSHPHHHRLTFVSDVLTLRWLESTFQYQETPFKLHLWLLNVIWICGWDTMTHPHQKCF